MLFINLLNQLIKSPNKMRWALCLCYKKICNCQTQVPQLNRNTSFMTFILTDNFNRSTVCMLLFRIVLNFYNFFFFCWHRCFYLPLTISFFKHTIKIFNPPLLLNKKLILSKILFLFFVTNNAFLCILCVCTVSCSTSCDIPSYVKNRLS